MIDIDWREVLVTGAAICSVIVAGATLAVGACILIGKELSRSSRKTLVIPESPEEVLLFSGRPNYSGLRNRTKQLQADEAARLV